MSEVTSEGFTKPRIRNSIFLCPINPFPFKSIFQLPIFANQYNQPWSLYCFDSALINTLVQVRSVSTDFIIKRAIGNAYPNN